jgi:hypothetical protein
MSRGIGYKRHFNTLLNEWAQQNGVDAEQMFGKSLPCHVTSVDLPFVTIAFDVITPFKLPGIEIPILQSQYVQLPIQVGCKGVTWPADTLLGYSTGVGTGGPPRLGQPANLASLSFMPLSTKSFTVGPDPLQVYIAAPHGALLQTEDGTASAEVSESAVTLTFEGNSVVVDSSGVAINGTLTINGDSYLGHMHTGVETGGDISGPVS